MIASTTPSREHLLSALCEAAELERTLMCTYLYAVFSLRGGPARSSTSRAGQGARGGRLSSATRARLPGSWQEALFSSP